MANNKRLRFCLQGTEKLRQHFNRLPTRYVLDVNGEGAEDVLMHMRFLCQFQDPANRPVFEVRLVQVTKGRGRDHDITKMTRFGFL
ncbi:Serine/threonine-protein kinase STY17-like protein [Drosera capensis]